MTTPAIAFIGSGNMANSLVGGLIADNYPSEKICVAGRTNEKLKLYEQRYQVATTTNNIDAVKQSDVVVMAVKPASVDSVTKEIAAAVIEHKPLLISIAAGKGCARYAENIREDIAIVRCMPNTPAMLRAGATALFANQYTTEEQKEVAESIMRSVGVTVWLSDEAQLDTVTALSGSGPAYFFLVIEALQQAAQSLGLSYDVAKLLTLQTALGAARMALESSDDVSILRGHVTSKGGTTEQAINVLEQGKIQELFQAALSAAKKRATELSQQEG